MRNAVGRGHRFPSAYGPALAVACITVLMSSSVRRDPLEGTWVWGWPRRSVDLPSEVRFLRISKEAGKWRFLIKHYMKEYFIWSARNVLVEDSHITFNYWYEPLGRWSHCDLRFVERTMRGTCEGELNARDWGPVPSVLWRED